MCHIVGQKMGSRGGIDLSDVVSLLGFLFLGGPALALGRDCVRIAGCPDDSSNYAQ